MKTSASMPVKLTASAKEELSRLFGGNTDPSKMLRIGVKGGGCSGLSYVLEMDERKERDEVHEIEGLPCLIDPAHQLYLFGMEIDWKTGLDARGFVFNNPNASATCGCGTSFAV
ncbi:MAG: HesB/IscA family protein [Bacteroidota bacterium]|jgi:iron-sulfur cluster assembly protein